MKVVGKKMAATLKDAAVTKAAAAPKGTVTASTKTAYAPPKAAALKATVLPKGGAPKAAIVKTTTLVAPSTISGVVVMKAATMGQKGGQGHQSRSCVLSCGSYVGCHCSGLGLKLRRAWVLFFVVRACGNAGPLTC
jgi:hypothetical protein